MHFCEESHEVGIEFVTCSGSADLDLIITVISRKVIHMTSLHAPAHSQVPFYDMFAASFQCWHGLTFRSVQSTSSPINPYLALDLASGLHSSLLVHLRIESHTYMWPAKPSRRHGHSLHKPRQ